ncbi:MAG: amino acid permease [Phycisphaerae bacterium]|nr:amino acid permease [Phycisphaerae bacterium]
MGEPTNESRRKLGFLDVFCIASGAMISSGLFVLPGLAFAKAGPAVVFSYALAAVLILPALLCQAELASAIPRHGATFVFIERSLGTFAGTFAGLAGWFAIALKSAFALVGIGAFARLIWPGTPGWAIRVVAIGFCVFFTMLNCLTVKGVGRAQVAMVIGLGAALLWFVGAGVGSPEFHPENFGGFFEKGAFEIIATAGLVFVSFGGLTATADIAGDVRRAARTVPLGMICALVIVGCIYVACVTVTVGVTTTSELTYHLTPLSLAADKFAGSAGMIVLACAAMLAFITTANGGILEASRTPLAMSHDGLLPSALQRHWKRRGTPVVCVLITGGFMTLVLATLTIENLVKVASTMLLVLYVLTCVSVLIIRQSRLQNYRPLFRVPLGPVLPLAGIVAYIFLIADMGSVPLWTTTAFAVGGLVWYLIYIRPRIARESALVFLVRRIVSKEIRRANLDEELKQIAIERDEIVHDRFDRIVQNGPVLDLPERIHAEELFSRAADVLAGRLGVSAKVLREKFLAREEESSTVIQPGLAIPHVIVEGKGKFEVLLVRCREGIVFDEKRPPVHTAFFLVGSANERNFHLRALMAVAHIVEQPEFADRWFAAVDAEHLRDLVVTTIRSRETETRKRE